MQTTNEKTLKAMTLRQTEILRFSKRLDRISAKLLRDTQEELRNLIVLGLQDHSGFRSAKDAKKVAALRKKISSLRAKAFTSAERLVQSELSSLGKEESEFLAKLFQAAVVTELAFATVSLETVENILDSKPFQGRLLKEWVKDLQASDLERIMSAIVTGMTQGQSIRQIVSAAAGQRGITKLTNKQLGALVRTAVSHISNDVRREFALLNAPVFEKELFVATLDSRTTAICRSNDGKKFPIGKGPLPPLHINCRSLRVPTLEGDVVGERPAKPVTQKMLLREYAQKNGLRFTPVDRNRLPRGHKGDFDEFSRKRIRELTGSVPAATSYSDWLKSLPQEIVEDILGKSKAKLFLKGKLPLSAFVDFSGREYTLKELARSQSRAFKLAGL